jgi:hypothetical protein
MNQELFKRKIQCAAHQAYTRQMCLSYEFHVADRNGRYAIVAKRGAHPFSFLIENTPCKGILTVEIFEALAKRIGVDRDVVEIFDLGYACTGSFDSMIVQGTILRDQALKADNQFAFDLGREYRPYIGCDWPELGQKCGFPVR